MLTIFHAQNYQNRSLLTKEELALIIRKDEGKTDVKKSERKMIERILNFTETKASEAMIPLVDVRALPSLATIDNAIQELKETGFSRYPIYSERVDNIIGILNIHELLFAAPDEQSIKKYINKINYVPESHPVDSLLVKMQHDGTSINAVVDEYGGCVGIITLEDILEEVVGDIDDEYDIEEPMIELIDANTFIINARASVEELNDKHGLKIPEGDYETIGGFILVHLKKIPTKGDSFHYRDLKITITKASSKAVEEVEIVKEKK
jgi:CBS domain containing-hemolysin-like protein